MDFSPVFREAGTLLRTAIASCPRDSLLFATLRLLLAPLETPRSSFIRIDQTCWAASLSSLLSFSSRAAAYLHHRRPAAAAPGAQNQNRLPLEPAVLSALNREALFVFTSLDVAGFYNAFFPSVPRLHLVARLRVHLPESVADDLAFRNAQMLLTSPFLIYFFLNTLCAQRVSLPSVADALVATQAQPVLQQHRCHSLRAGAGLFRTTLTNITAFLEGLRRAPVPAAPPIIGRIRALADALVSFDSFPFSQLRSQSGSKFILPDMYPTSAALPQSPVLLRARRAYLHPSTMNPLWSCRAFVACFPLSAQQLQIADRFAHATLLMRSLSSPYVVTYHGSYWPSAAKDASTPVHPQQKQLQRQGHQQQQLNAPKIAFVVVEHTDMDLFEAHSLPALAQPQIRLRLFADILRGMVALQESRVFVPGLSPASVRINVGSNGMQPHAKLDVTSVVSAALSTVSVLPSTALLFQPPELMPNGMGGSQHALDLRSNIWAVAATAVFLFSKHFDFEQIYVMFRSNSPEFFASSLLSMIQDWNIRDILRPCFFMNLEERPTALELLTRLSAFTGMTFSHIPGNFLPVSMQSGTGGDTAMASTGTAVPSALLMPASSTTVPVPQTFPQQIALGNQQAKALYQLANRQVSSTPFRDSPSTQPTAFQGVPFSAPNGRLQGAALPIAPPSQDSPCNPKTSTLQGQVPNIDKPLPTAGVRTVPATASNAPLNNAVSTPVPSTAIAVPVTIPDAPPNSGQSPQQLKNGKNATYPTIESARKNGADNGPKPISGSICSPQEKQKSKPAENSNAREELPSLTVVGVSGDDIQQPSQAQETPAATAMKSKDGACTFEESKNCTSSAKRRRPRLPQISSSDEDENYEAAIPTGSILVNDSSSQEFPSPSIETRRISPPDDQEEVRNTRRAGGSSRRRSQPRRRARKKQKVEFVSWSDLEKEDDAVADELNAALSQGSSDEKKEPAVAIVHLRDDSLTGQSDINDGYSYSPQEGAMDALIRCLKERTLGLSGSSQIQFRSFQNAAGRAEPGAMLSVGLCHVTGTGTEQDRATGAKIILRAASTENGDALYCVGLCAEDGIGVEKKETDALRWFRRAASKRHLDSKYRIGLMLKSGRGEPEDMSKAASMFAEAARAGHVPSKVKLANCLARGAGVKRNMTRAIDMYRDCESRGDPEAMLALGLLHEDGHGVRKDPKKALALYKKAAHLKYGPAQTALGQCYLWGYGLELDHRAAFHCFQGAAETGHDLAFHELGNLYRHGTAVEQDYEKAVELYRKASGQGLSVAMVQLGECLYYGHGIEQDEDAAFAQFRQAAELGAAEGLRWMGDCYLDGSGVDVNKELAVNYFHRGAKQGSAVAHTSLGQCYERGEGVPVSLQKAFTFYKKAADVGDHTAMTNLGLFYEQGKGVKQDYARAVKMYADAIDLGNTAALCNLGDCYMEGRGINKNVKKAVELYQQGVKHGMMEAFCELGICYYLGKGVKEDAKKALEYLRKAEDCEPEAQRYIGKAYLDGKGVASDPTKAVAMFKRAVKGGNGEAMVDLGRCCRLGAGVSQDDSRAVELFREAANGPHFVKMAMLELGTMIYRGQGTPQDYHEAVKWMLAGQEEDQELE